MVWVVKKKWVQDREEYFPQKSKRCDESDKPANAVNVVNPVNAVNAVYDVNAVNAVNDEATCARYKNY